MTNDVESQRSEPSYLHMSFRGLSIVYHFLCDREHDLIPGGCVWTGTIGLILIARRHIDVPSFCENGCQPHDDGNLASESTASRYFRKSHTSQLESVPALLHASIGDQE